VQARERTMFRACTWRCLIFRTLQAHFDHVT
jgi:hypothetical protein